MGLYRDDERVLERGVSAASMESVYAFPALTRSQGKLRDVEKQVRFDDEAAPEPRKKEKTPTWKTEFKAPEVQKPAEETQFSRIKTKVPSSAPHPINTEEGWRASEKAKQDDRRARVEDVPDEQDGASRWKSAKSQPYRFTSSLQETVSADAVQGQILDTKITLSLREILGMSPDLQKRMQSMVKTRREFNAKSGTWESNQTDADEIIEVSEPISGSNDENAPSLTAFLTYDGQEAQLRSIMDRYSHAVAIGARKHYAMAAGLVQGIFGGEKVVFLVDSGSELNLMTRRVWEQTDVRIDEDGKRWSLRGIGGETVPLLGCCIDAPVQLGGKNFDHHFFVSNREHGNYDGILGQPWLNWFSADISYNRGGVTHLRAYVGGDKTASFSSIEIARANNPRNADRLALTSEALRTDDEGPSLLRTTNAGPSHFRLGTSI